MHALPIRRLWKTLTIIGRKANIVTEAWVYLWLTCFKHNKPFRKYCEAMRAKNTRIQRNLEHKYEHIAALYEDWGDIHSFNHRVRESLFRPWLEKRRHLFFPDSLPPAELLTQIERIETGFIYLKVPINPSIKAARAEADRLVTEAYRSVRKPKNRAKYQLANKVPSYKALQSTRKALNVWELFYASESKPKIVEVVAAIIHRTQRADLSKFARTWGWEKKDLRSPDLATQILRYRREGEAIIANTIHGAFPVKRQP